MNRTLLLGRLGWITVMGLVSLAYFNGLNAPKRNDQTRYDC